MHQSLLLYSQATISVVVDGEESPGYFHHHVECKEYLRKVDEITLETDVEFEYKEVYDILDKWKPDGAPWSEER